MSASASAQNWIKSPKCGFKISSIYSDDFCANLVRKSSASLESPLDFSAESNKTRKLN